MPDSLTAAIAHLEETERALQAQMASIATQLEGTRRALVALREVAGVSAPPPVPPATPTRPTPRPRPDASVEQNTPRVPAVPAAARLMAGPLGTRAAEHRERQLLRLIAKGTKATSLLRGELPIEAGATSLQHTRAVQNALSRLRADGLIVRGDDGWELTAKGRKAADGSAKEAL